jgi:GNAT superfamily N-acetyltransferase
MRTFGIDGAAMRWTAWGALIAAELILAAGVAAGSDTAALLAAAMLAFFGLALVSAIQRGRAGAPCACFGARSTISWRAVARNFALAAAFAVVPVLPTSTLTTDQWLGLGLGVALLACAGLLVAVLALAREVGLLRLRMGPESALEIPEEGPPLGERIDPGPLFELTGGEELLLAAFTSDGCHVCRTIEPQLAQLAADPILAVRVFEEVADTQVWADLEIPGSPYAVALDPDGTVLAKGSFNTLAQLESVLATAERRRAGIPQEVMHG